VRLSPEANGREHFEAADLVAGDIAEAIPQRPLDRRLGGVSIEALAAEQGQPVPSAS
jgi:hypothetical protein